MASCGISGPDSIQFRNVIDEFRKYNFDWGKIMLAFADVQDIVVEKYQRNEVRD